MTMLAKSGTLETTVVLTDIIKNTLGSRSVMGTLGHPCHNKMQIQGSWHMMIKGIVDFHSILTAFFLNVSKSNETPGATINR